MKKLTTIALILILTAIALTASAELYPETAKVVKVDTDADLVMVVTSVGHLFTFEGCEDWAEGDCVSLIMEDNGTDWVLDDEILTAKYSAWDLNQ